MFNLKWKKNWFTLAETVIVCTVFAIMILWVIIAINRAYTFLNDTRLRVMATNFAREGVEMMYNFRDTNRRKNPWDKDSHRIDIEGGAKLSSWIYIINEGESASGIYLTGLAVPNINDFYDIEWFFGAANSGYREQSKITFTGSYKYLSGWVDIINRENNVKDDWDLKDFMDWFWATFYRVVRVYGVFCKNSNNPNDTSPNESDPKELRFCVKVFYDVNGWHHASELCSIMTNFLK